MCGRFTNRYSWNELVRLYRITEPYISPIPNTPARYNVAPTQFAPVIRLKDGRREISLLKWGLVPAVAKDASGGAKLINARAESVADKPAFRSAFLRRRCLVIADGFYEWAKVSPKEKQPYFITLKDDAPFAFAGLYEWWKLRDGSDILETFTIITTAANTLVAPLHDRMPVILTPEHWPLWLGEELPSPSKLQSLLKPFPAERMECWPVDKRVGNVAVDAPELIERMAAAQA